MRFPNNIIVNQYTDADIYIVNYSRTKYIIQTLLNLSRLQTSMGDLTVLKMPRKVLYIQIFTISTVFSFANSDLHYFRLRVKKYNAYSAAGTA